MKAESPVGPNTGPASADTKATGHTAASALDWAYKYILRGYPVLPCIGKRPAGHLVPNGFKDATTHIAVVERWFLDPDLNIGIATGKSSFDVLDIDNWDQFTCWADGRQLPNTLRSVTGSGGSHLLFQPAGTRNNVKRVPGCDWRGDGGYIIAPPSIHPDTGRQYRWDNWGAPILECPDWLKPASGHWIETGSVLADAGYVGSRSATGMALLNRPEGLDGVGTRQARDGYIRAAFRRELQGLAKAVRGRNDALFAAVLSMTRFADTDAAPVVRRAMEISAQALHADHPQWGPMTPVEISATTGSAICRRLELTLHAGDGR